MLSKVQLTCLREDFEGIFPKRTFSHLRFSNEKSSSFWLNFSVRFGKLAFYFSTGTVWGVLNLFKILFLKCFHLSSEKYLDIWQNFSGRLIKLHSKSSEQFAVNHKFPKLFFFPLSHLIVQRNFLRLSAKVFGLIVQKDYTCPVGFSVEKHVCVRKKSFSLSFLNLERNISNFYPEHFSEELSILLSRCSEESFYKSFSLKKYQDFILYLAKMRKYFNFERKYFERFATTVAARWTFSVTFFPDEGKFFLIFGLWSKKWLFGRFFFGRFVKSAVYVSAWIV